MNIQIVNETGCYMYLDDHGNYIDSFFIGQYWFSLMTSKQKETLKEILEKNHITPFEIFYKDDNIYLTFNDGTYPKVYEIYNDGMARCHRQIEVLDIVDDSFILLHDFN